MPIAPMFHGNGWQMVTAPLSGQGLVLRVATSSDKL
jgi:hypothetical protein